MSLHAIVKALGGDLWAGGRRASVPAPGHSPADRSVSLLLVDGRVVVHSFGAASWQEVRDDLRARGLIDAAGAPLGAGGVGTAEPRGNPFVASASARIAAARALWDAAVPLRPGGLAALHCARRAIRQPPETLGDLRSHPAVPLSVYAGRGPARPALLAGVRDAAGDLCAVEVTYLGPDGRRARTLRLPRKTVGVLPAGCAVRLAPAAGEMLVAEGVFTTLSAMSRFALPGWALLSTSNLRRWTPPQGVRSVLVAGDRGRDGEVSAARLAAALRALGIVAQVRFPPPPHGDWNDLAQWEARRKGGPGRPERGEGP